MARTSLYKEKGKYSKPKPQQTAIRSTYSQNTMISFDCLKHYRQLLCDVRVGAGKKVRTLIVWTTIKNLFTFGYKIKLRSGSQEMCRFRIYQCFKSQIVRHSFNPQLSRLVCKKVFFFNFASVCFSQYLFIRKNEVEELYHWLTTQNSDYQLGWAILAECRQLDTHKHIFHFMSWNSPYLTCYITLRVHNINGQSTVPPLHFSLRREMEQSFWR